MHKTLKKEIKNVNTKGNKTAKRKKLNHASTLTKVKGRERKNEQKN